MVGRKFFPLTHYILWFIYSQDASCSGVMQCPFCQASRDKVIDSRGAEGGRVIRRRRECLGCKKRFTTYERVEETVRLMVIKKDGGRVPYERQKIAGGLQKACYKRPISTESMDRLVAELEEDLFKHFDREVTSAYIGEAVSRRLRLLDKVAYVRFASVYRAFADVGEFLDEVQDVLEKAKHDTPGQQQLFKDE